MEGRRNILAVLNNKGNDRGYLLFEVLSTCFEGIFASFETQTEHYRKIALHYLFASMPNASSRSWKPNVLPLHKVNVANWTDVDKVFEADIAKPQSFQLKRDSFGVFLFINSDKSVLEAGIINFFLSFFLADNQLDTLRFFQKMMIKLALQHKIVIVDLLQLFQKFLLTDDQLYHLLGNRLPNFLNYTLE